jgi:hypothetical protein
MRLYGRTYRKRPKCHLRIDVKTLRLSHDVQASEWATGKRSQFIGMASALLLLSGREESLLDPVSIHPSIDVNCLVTHHKTHAAPSKEEGAASINWCEWVHPSISWWRIENITGERYSCPSDDEHFLYQEIIRSSFSLILGLSHIGQLDSSSRSFYPFFFSFTPNCKTLGWY